MPRIASNNKQKNKRFKGSSKHAKRNHPKAKATTTKTKGIIKTKENKKNLKIQRIK